PVYEDGEKIEYNFTEDPVEGYDQSIIGFNVTNSHIIETVWFPVGITWLDNDNAGNTRPESVTVNLLMNGESKQEQVISPNEYGACIYEFDVTALSRNNPNAEFSVAAINIEGYTCEIDTSESFYNIILLSDSVPAFKMQSLVLGGQIGVNFFMNLPTIDGVDYSTSFMTFSVEHGTCTEQDVFDSTHKNNNGEGKYYGFTCFVNSIQMAEPITATFHYVQDGVEKTVEKIYSVDDYFTAFEDAVTAGKITDDATIDLVHALADYGHYVQPFLSNERGWTMGTDYATLDTHYAESYGISTIKNAVSGKAIDVTNNTGGDIKKITYSLTLDSDTVINVYFKPGDGYDGNFTATVDDKPVDCTKSGGRCCVKISGIAAHELSKSHTIIVTTAEGHTATVTVSAMSYVNSALIYYTDDEDAQYAVASLYAYSNAADAYNKDSQNNQ
ncbi:MAG: Cna B-type domain-containing protein, partial [Clostridiales bacterium]|nr:Cna B-type domain-containing protein [Clostridiales bacterium]